MSLHEADLAALAITLRLAATTTVVLLLLGTPLAWWLSRTRWRGKFLIEAVVALPWCCRPRCWGSICWRRSDPRGRSVA